MHTAHSVYTCIYNHRTIGANKGKKITEIKNQAKIKRTACRVPSHMSQHERTSGLFRQEKKEKHKLTDSTQKGSSWKGEESLTKPISRHISIGWAKDQAGVCSGSQPTDDDDDDDDSQVTETYS